MNQPITDHHLLGVGDAALFPVLDSLTYLDHAAVSPLPRPVAAAMRRYVDAWERFGSQSWAYDMPARLRRLAATLIQAASEEEIAIVPNTSTGLSTVARGLQLGPNDTVVVPQVEFPANRFVWEDLQQDGVRVVIVPADGELQVADDALIQAMHDTFKPDATNLLALSHVQFATGQHHDVARLARAAHHCRGLIVVDAIQSIGHVPFHVEAMGIDFASADGHKWMLGPEGVGIFYCRRIHLERLRPPIVGWLNMVDAASFSGDHMILRRDGRRFEPGCWNIAGICGLSASLELLLKAGLEAIENRLLDLARFTRAAAHRAGYDVVGGVEPQHPSAITALWPRPEQGRPDHVVKTLEERGIRIAARRGLIRISPHFYNTEHQIEQAIEALAACR